MGRSTGNTSGNVEANDGRLGDGIAPALSLGIWMDGICRMLGFLGNDDVILYVEFLKMVLTPDHQFFLWDLTL